MNGATPRESSSPHRGPSAPESPLAACVLIVVELVLLAVAQFGGGTPWTVLVALALVQAWVPHLAFAANPPGWSLSVEAFFYAVFPFVVHRLRCRTVRQLVALTVPLWVLAMAPASRTSQTHCHIGCTQRQM